MSPVDPNAGRHFGGRGEAPGAWTCPTCGAKNAGPVGEGCGSCGAGGAVANAAAAAKATVEVPVSPLEMCTAVYGHAYPHNVRRFNLTPMAHTTLVRAVEFYLAQGSPTVGDLPLLTTRAWLTYMLELDDAYAATVADETTTT